MNVRVAVKRWAQHIATGPMTAAAPRPQGGDPFQCGPLPCPASRCGAGHNLGPRQNCGTSWSASLGAPPTAEGVRYDRFCCRDVGYPAEIAA
jgi:hypothetical protein